MSAVTDALRRQVPAARPRIEIRPCRWDGFSAIVELHGEHDLATCEAVRVAFARLRGNLLVDLSACSFIDSMVIGTIVEASNSLARSGYRLEIVLPPRGSRVRRTLEIVRIGDVVPTRYGPGHEAERSFSHPTTVAGARLPSAERAP
jgi:anti-anti-sigma factor